MSAARTVGAGRSATSGGRDAARRAADSRAMEYAGRAGLAGRGVIYLLVAALALHIALNGSDQQADRGGALEEVAKRPFGSWLVWALGVALVGMALWRLSEAAFGAADPKGHKARKRATSAARAVFYSFVAYSVLSFAIGEKGSGSGSSDKQSKDATARVLELPWGQWLVAAAGLGVGIAGVVIAVRAARRKYHKHLKQAKLSERSRRVVDLLGVPGGVVRGCFFLAAGVFAAQAARDADPDEAKGMDNTLRSFTDTPAGPWLLVAVGVGLALFGAFSLALARWRRV
ncbi:DUF1206 domain-containing protein [Streptomyces sp. NPDC005438]|uniref:DUF1206 domain-containing protein n=1 Tax=Streptomyces sp. NPDC005438 TaxID=3156880 RepID=UPI0033A477B3